MVEIQRAHEHSMLSIAIPLLPAAGKNAPFRIEVSTNTTGIGWGEGSEQDGERIVAWCRGQFIVARLVQFKGC